MWNRIPCQWDAGTRLVTALRRRPFSACNKGNRRRLHAGNFCLWLCCYSYYRGVHYSRVSVRQEGDDFSAKTLCKSSVSLSKWPVWPRSSQPVLTFGKHPECGVKLAQSFSLIRKWTFAVVIITQLLLYSHFFLLVIGVSMAKQECTNKYLLLLLLLLLSY